ncbi:hypothetical protein SS50377_25685 [Spironucleus salmonicida]|uniref:Uncharacterized protein n=1 Tax=Spironucleus salmonicida TaxID=348837 RepID=V6LEN3_9EUKA|nr:hypothetical protein SS50377_25685 [Spironucleus salmonicida]|eukprot:EST42713.1 Hypothetical protein SS50377_17736 [Spironucleus salmonicida]
MSQTDYNQFDQSSKILDVKQTIQLNKQMINNLTSQLRQFEQQVTQLESRNQQLVSQDQLQLQDLQKLSQKCLDYEQVLGGLYTEQKDHISQLQAQQDKINILNNKLQQQEQSQQGSTQQQEQIKIQNKQLQDKVLEQQTKLFQINQDLQLQKEDNFCIKQSIETLKQQHSSQLQQDNSLKNDLEDKILTQVKTIRQFQEVQQQLDNTVLLKENTIAQLKQQLIKANEKQSQSISEFEKHISDQQILKVQQQQLVSNLSSHQQQNNSLKTQVEYLNQQNQQIQTQSMNNINQLNQQIKELKYEVQNQNNKENEKFEVLTQQNDELIEQTQKLQQNNFDLKQALTQLQTQNQIENVKIIQRNQELEQQNQKLKDVQKDVIQSKENESKLKKNFQNLQAEHDNLLNEIYGIKDNIQEEYRILQENQTMLGTSKIINQDLLEVKISALENASNALKIAVSSQQGEINMLKNTSQIKSISASEQSPRSSHNSAIGELQNQISDMHNQILNLKALNSSQFSDLPGSKNSPPSIKLQSFQPVHNDRLVLSQSSEHQFLDQSVVAFPIQKQLIFNIFSSFSPDNQKQLARSIGLEQVNVFIQAVFKEQSLDQIYENWDLQTEILTKQKLVKFFEQQKIEITRRDMTKLYESDLADDTYVTWIMGLFFFVISQGDIVIDSGCDIYQISGVKVMVIENE